MKTIKVIDLLNRIANGEAVPKKILIRGYEYRLSEGFRNSYFGDKGNINFAYEEENENYWLDMSGVNEEVEIIEEDKEIEEIEIIDKTEEQMKFYNCTYNKETREYEFELKDIEIDYLYKNFEGNKGNIYGRLDKNFKEIEYYLKALANAVNELKKGK